MGSYLNEAPSGRRDGAPGFSEAYLVSARYGECRRVAGKVLSIFQIACGINECLVTCKQDQSFKISDLPMADVLAMVPKGRQYQASGQSSRPSPDQEAYLTVHPILLLKLGGFTLVLDGLKRLEFLQKKGSNLIRCVLINEERAFYFGRKGIDVFDDKGGRVELDKKQRTFKNTVPPSIDESKPYPGKEYDGEVRPALSKKRRMSMPKVRPEGEDGRQGDIVERDKYLIENTVLNTIAPHIAAVKNRCIQMTLELPKKSKIRRELDLDHKHQKLLDLKIDVSENVFKEGNAQQSLHEILLIRFLLNLFEKIESLHVEMKSAGLLKQQKSSSRDGVYNPRVGHTIVDAENRYRTALGHFPDLREKMKDWADIAALTDGVFASGLHEGLFEIGLRRRHDPGDHPLIDQQRHAYELLQSALKALRRAENQTGNLRDLRQHNNGKALKSDLRFDLDYAVDGEPAERNLEAWDVDRTFRVLLALHARLNPAKIWRDETHLTLMYQWLIVLGDLNRHGRMIVTSHMAQEFFLVHGFRSGGDNPALDSDWSFFDEALYLAVADHPARAKAVTELVELCAVAMQKGRAVRVLREVDGPRCFEPFPLSKESSVLAEAAIWLT